MIKKSETTEDCAITEPSSPPNVESLHAEAQPEELPSHHDNIQFIISSNEELIHLQTLTIKSLQAANEGQQEEIKTLREQY